jgi:excisionase family DNA binding protein
MSTKPLVVRPKTALELLGIGKTTLYLMLRDGRLERTRLGQRAIGITISSIEELIRKGLKQQPPAA